MAEKLIVFDTEMTQLANKIREKTNSTDPLSFPQGFINAIDNAAGGLNFEVVSGTTEPTNLKENTIWVNTTTNITNHVFSAKAPTTYSEGTVWFELSATGNVGVKAIDDNTDFIELHPRAVYQRISNTWQEKTASVYQNGSWVTFMNVLYVLKNGVVNPAMGTYVNVARSPMSNGVITATQNSSYGNYGYFSQLVTLNGSFKTLRFHVNVTSVLDSTYKLRVGVSKKAMVEGQFTDNSGKFSAYKALDVGTQWANIDISGLSGDYYISFCSIASFTMDEIVLTSEVF